MIESIKQSIVVMQISKVYFFAINNHKTYTGIRFIYTEYIVSTSETFYSFVHVAISLKGLHDNIMFTVMQFCNFILDLFSKKLFLFIV